jgi:hypothetical protein
VPAHFIHKSVAKSTKTGHGTSPELLLVMPRDAPRIYWITPPISDWSPYPLFFEEALAACNVACVLLRFAARKEDEKEKIVRALALWCKGRALLVWSPTILNGLASTRMASISMGRRSDCNPPCVPCGRTTLSVRAA